MMGGLMTPPGLTRNTTLSEPGKNKESVIHFYPTPINGLCLTHECLYGTTLCLFVDLLV